MDIDARMVMVVSLPLFSSFSPAVLSPAVLLHLLAYSSLSFSFLARAFYQ
jgi:hypothetical protein